jgi:hypothetical protein
VSSGGDLTVDSRRSSGDHERNTFEIFREKRAAQDFDWSCGNFRYDVRCDHDHGRLGVQKRAELARSDRSASHYEDPSAGELEENRKD